MVAAADPRAQRASTLFRAAEEHSGQGRRKEALSATEEAVALFRTLAAEHPQTFNPDLAMSLDNLGVHFSALGRRSEALAATEEAVKLFRTLAAENPQTFNPDLAWSLNSLGIGFSDLGRRSEALAAMSEAGQLVVGEKSVDNPHEWCDLCGRVVRFCDRPSDLRDIHLPLLSSLTERRELAYSAEHAGLFLALQAEIVDRLWTVLSAHAAAEPELLSEALPIMVSALQSPDLARWMESQSEDSPLRRSLAQAKRAVIAADQAYHDLLTRIRGGSGSGGPEGARGGRDSAVDPEAQQVELKKADGAAEQARAQYRAVRAKLIETDPAFRSAYEPSTLSQLREGLAQLTPPMRDRTEASPASALLCLLTLGDNPQSSDGVTGASRKAVGVLLHTGAASPTLIEFPGLIELAQTFSQYEPAGNRTGAVLRRAPVLLRDEALSPATDDATEGDTARPDLDQLAEALESRFWQPLRRALARHDPAAGGSLEPVSSTVLHVCGHGSLHQLPLRAVPVQGLTLIQWPGLPYFRLAALSAPTAQDSFEPPLSASPSGAPWQIGHDCAWTSAPIPMAVVEAHLLLDLLQHAEAPRAALEEATALQPNSQALIACCHGARAAHLDSALSLGTRPLTVSEVVEKKLGSKFVLLPVCHAGETQDDGAGNALGVAAGFLLSGTRVVIASAKAVPDLLIPWFTTLVVWHIVKDRMSAYSAALLAREEFGACRFPKEYRDWLSEALPPALAPLQPGGAEAPGIAAACEARAIKDNVATVRPQALLGVITGNWPWSGLLEDLFSADIAKRKTATASVAQSILLPREDRDEAQLRHQLREMAAFIYVYG
ncbi:MAG: CHAT domain-containing protein, partial [Rhodocyclaceae bacterium]|nr:CHAT domain-containing protein [Rhodocyclaceae bacterium]